MPELDRLVAARAGQLGTMAAAWIAAGATAVELWGSAGLAARWAPDLELGTALSAGARSTGRATTGAHGRAPRGGGVHAPITVDDTQLGWLRLVGVNGAVTRRRLVSDAAAIGALLSHEADLTDLTEALVEAQDRLLGIGALLRAVDPAAGPEALAAAVAAEAQALLEVPLTAVALPAAPSAPSTPAHGWTIAACPAGARDAIEELLDDLVLDPADPVAVEHVTPDGWLVARSAARPGRLPLLIARADPGIPWASPTLRLAAAIADLATTLVAQADHVTEAMERQRLERELAFAGEVQALLLGRHVPALAGVAVATRYRPVRWVGGDLFGVQASGGRTLLALGDVSGKGPGAALLMATGRAVFEAFAPEATGPAALLDRMGAALAADLEAATAFMTIAVAELDPAAGTLRIANAGHAPVLLRGADGVRLLEPDDPPLGVLEGLQHAERSHPFHADGLLLLGSDGITERESPTGELYGIDRLIDHIAVADGSPDEIADRLLADVDRFADARPRGDDETLLVARGTR
ncbi:MAG: PP2C family protein-serine/threonine phosphatase [Chloroflexota bacterium]